MQQPEDGHDQPSNVTVYNSVAVPNGSPEKNVDYWPDFESESSTELRRYVDRGDDVVIIGGGWGVTTVVAARMTHYEGTVTTFEATSDMYEAISRTVKVNNVEDVVDLRHQSVGTVFEFSTEHYGPADGGSIAPEEVPPCDVLELDCEGSERSILENMTCRPDYIIVESHGPAGVTAGEITEILDDIGYAVIRRGGADQEYEALTAERVE